jgi:hypothetical protein
LSVRVVVKATWSASEHRSHEAEIGKYGNL